MKKKLMLAIAIIAVVAISVTVLAGCGVKTVEQFAEKLDKATCLTMTSEYSMIQFDGKTTYTKMTYESKTREMYTVIDGDKSITYAKDGDKWYKMENEMSAEDKKELSIKKMFEEYGEKLDKTLYDEKDGVWTLKTDKTITLKIVKGNLVMTQDKTEVTFSLKKITVKLPKEAESAEEYKG